MPTKIIDKGPISVATIKTSSGYTPGISNAYNFYLEVYLNSQDIENNTSNITVNHYGQGRNGYGYSSFSTPKSVITVNGVDKQTTTVSSIPTSGAKTPIGTWTGNIAHNSDGTMSITVSVNYNPYTSSTTYYYVPTTNTISDTVQLTTIPRASSVSVSAHTITSSSGTLSYSVTSKTNYYHKAQWTLGSTTSSVLTLGNINNTTASFTIANTELLNALPTQTTGSLTITVSTYSDSGYTTLVGTQTGSATVSVDTSSIKPTTTLNNPASNTSPISGYLVAGYSTAKATWSASGGYGANGTTTYFTVSNGTVTSTSSASASGTVTTNTLPASTSNYTLTISAYTKDGRGAVGSTVSKTITVYGYEPPTATLTAFRTETSSSTTEDGAGVYVYVTYSGTANSSVNNQNSIQSTTCTYTGSISGTVSSSGAHIRLADTENATFTLTVTDKVSSSSATVSIPTANYPLDLYDNGSGVVGGAFGGIAERGYTKTYLPTKGFFVYGTCSTARATRAKVVSDANLFTQDSLITGSVVFIKFSKANGVADPTLTINGIGPVSIKRYGTTAPSTARASSWNAGSVVCFVYDGTYWQQVGFLNSTYGEISVANITNTTGSSAGTITGRRFTSAFDYHIGLYRRLVWCKNSATLSISASSNGTPTLEIAKQVGSAFSISSGNIVCSVAGTVKVTAKVFAWHNSTNGGAMNCYITQNSTSNTDTKSTVSWFSNGVAYLEAILDVSANDTLNVYIENVSASGAISVQIASSMIVEYL